MRPTHQSLVDAGKLLRPIVAAFGGHRTGRQVDGPAIQRGPAVTAGTPPVAIKHP
ncbi:Uncharacterised protein [Mycobacterium tuberculosis]|uniref:Uncharacterized protein n=1 Tax=Mycobacterium tuberculosis TaxID=1773 RepID=A0A0U0SQD1_MYCTX|nr:Uncharacterised protein [Mycobacterium tuberculosis]COZ04381.1 Uncharacterised protein [Mycobacterium tuberculosis]